MRKILFPLLLVSLLFGCAAQTPASSASLTVAATTSPMAQAARAITEGTDIAVETVIGESVSCLHDYSLSVRQMETLENADAVILSGAGLEDFMQDALSGAGNVIDASEGVKTLPGEDGADPHIWLDPVRYRQMVQTVTEKLSLLSPENAPKMQENCEKLTEKLTKLHEYGKAQFQDLPVRELVTFHDGFAYFADTFGLSVLAAIEEEAGSEVPAATLERIVGLVREHHLPAVFSEKNSSASAAGLVAAETQTRVFPLDTALGEDDYFTAMHHNIDTIREALG